MPLAPILMSPAYRCGSATPWGGEGLRMMFGRDIPDARTGESLEISAIPGLESRDPEGRKLTDLIEEYGEQLTGPGFAHPFPLLLKLIDAKDRLSVQVHPDDAYAARVEGKQGKTEAWHILFAAPGAELVYGVQPGTDKDALRKASQEGAAVEPLLRKVKVRAGQTYFIPAGTVHAIGAGIILYEIQQSSDVTYRFYDWDRRDANGNRRELHLDKALDVADLRCVPVPVRVEKAFGVKRVLSEPYFTLDMIRTDTMECLPPINGFGILTVTEGELELRFSGGYIRMKAGETCLLPNYAPVMALVGVGAAALAMPN